MYANRNRANRPTALTAADHARQRAAIARHDKRQARARMRERINRAAVYIAVALAVLMGIHAATDHAPATDSSTYRATGWDGATVAHGLTMPDCLENYFNRPDVAGCNRE